VNPSVPNRSVLAALVCLLGLAISAAAGAHGPATKLHGAVTPAETQAFDEARPAFERHCFRCHSRDVQHTKDAKAKPKAKALSHLDMTAYPFGGHHAGAAGAAVLEALGVGPQPTRAIMPPDKPGSVPADDLRLIRAWAEAFAAAHGPDAGAASK
jgi:hypothetical protein